MRHFLTVFLVTSVLVGCSKVEKRVTTAELSINASDFAEALDIKYHLLTNIADERCDKSKTDGFCFSAQLELTSPVEFTQGKWAIYFSHMSPIQMDDSELFDIVHINGDLHKLEPTAALEKIAPDQTYTIPFRAGFWHLSHTDMMPNYYLATEQGDTFVIASTKPVVNSETGLENSPHVIPLTLADKHFKRSGNDKTLPATANRLFDQNQPFYKDVNVSREILPMPKHVEYPVNSGLLDLGKGLLVTVQGIDSATLSASFDRLQKFGVTTHKEGVALTVNQVEGLPPEGYELEISGQEINVKASTDVGAFYAIQSLSSLLMPNSTQVPYMKVVDAPRFAFRGMHLDVSRNFKSKQFVLQLLEQMAAYKLNKFHFHLADDEGWRVAIKDLPELTQVGAFRCHDLAEQNCLLPQLGVGPNRQSPTNGYYSIEDYKEIVAFAQARHIQVIPSMDMPGHSRAAIKSMAARFTKLMQQGKPEEAKQYLLHDVEDSTKYSSIQFYNDNTINACLDSSYQFIGKIIDELSIMHQQAGQPLVKYHIGADETAGAWVNSPACSDLLAQNVMGIEKAEDIAAYFIERVSAMLADRGIQSAGWSDGMGHTAPERMPKSVQTNAWSPLMWDGHKSAHEQANRGWQVVVSSPDVLYFDFPYEPDANERGYYWAARSINSKKVFEFMPQHLPAHAEFWRNREDLPYEAIDDSPLKSSVTFHGIQGQLWSETVRTDEQASYMIFPRLYALAERAWHKAKWELDYPYEAATYSSKTKHFSDLARQAREQDWTRFANVLGKKVLAKAETEGVFFRLPTVGGKFENDQLKLNSIYPGLVLEYKTANQDWRAYQSPITVTGAVTVRAVSPLGHRKGRSLTVTDLN